ncbi:hypothetical protein [Bradyrhizobium retamae]|uniref:Uncharacterized protein n=1 Tax=Bradyrhizobium retamae TaxID=1300035 RepID=A0A0R3MRY5_9BRAD|nr:hypothetical protein [Bradyrhizobium retamae]KRR20368.1 hypothetical protein CQ13_32510 [Bradyrhizobium retamae]
MASWASKIRAHSASKQPRPRKPRPVVHTAWAQTRPPNEEIGDPGAVIDIHYTLEDNAVTLTNDKGAPIGGKAGSYVLQPGENAARIATRLGLAEVDRSHDAPMNVSWVV